MKWFCFCEDSIAMHQPRSLMCIEDISLTSSASSSSQDQVTTTTKPEEPTKPTSSSSSSPSSSEKQQMSPTVPLTLHQSTENESMSTTTVSPSQLSPLLLSTPPPPTLIHLSKEEKDVLAKYSVHSELQTTCEQCLRNQFDSNLVSYIMNNLEVPISDIQIITLNNCDQSTLNTLLNKKLQCDRNFSAVLTYIRGSGIEELSLFQLDSILDLFTFNMFFRIYFFKCLTGNNINIKPYEKHPITNVNVNYKNIISFIEDMVECAVYEGNYQFLSTLHSKIIELKIPFILSSREKEIELLHWIYCTMSNTSDEEKKKIYEQTFDAFYSWFPYLNKIL